jgi:hypothetical protein
LWSLPGLYGIRLGILALVAIRGILLHKLLLTCRSLILNLVVRIYIYLWLKLTLINLGLLRTESRGRIATLLLLLIWDRLRIEFLISLLLGSTLVRRVWRPRLWITLIFWLLPILLIFWYFWILLTSSWAASCLKSLFYIFLIL